MFSNSKIFGTDIRKWDEFLGAKTPNGNLTNWDVLSVKNISQMLFVDVTLLFNHKLCVGVLTSK